MNHLFYYLRGALGERGLVKEHEEVLQRLLSGDFNSGNLEKLKGHEVYSFRLNKPGRLLFTLVTLEGTKRLLVLDYLPTHDYHKSRFLKSRVLGDYLKRVNREGSEDQGGLDFISIEPNEVSEFLPRLREGSPREAPKGITVDYFQNKVIRLSEEQEGVLNLRLPAAIRGGAGSGKTAVALSIISSTIEAAQNEDDGIERRIVYVAQSTHLVESVSAAWETLPQAVDARHKVLFKSYNDLIKEPLGLSNASLVREPEFNDWYQQFCIKERHSAKAHKKAHETALAASTVYQECRLCSGYREEEYTRLGERQSLIGKEKREWLYGLYKSYQEHLKNKEHIDPAFHYFVEQEQESYDLVLVDEGQDLSFGQLSALSGLAKKGQFVVLMDDNQRLNDELSMFSRGCDLLQIPPKHRVTLHASHRCPPQIMAAAGQVLKFREFLAQGVLEKNSVREESKEDRSTKMGGVYVLDEKELATLAWLVNAAKGVDFAIITSEEHVEEARKRFKTPLVFTPERIKGLEYRVVMAWRLYSPEIFKAISKRIRELGPEARQPTHQAKNGEGTSTFNPHLHGIYTAYTRATEMLLIAEPKSQAENPLLKKILPFAEKVVPLGNELHLSRGSREEWFSEVNKQINAGNEELAKEIYLAQKLGAMGEFVALLQSRRPQQAPPRVAPEDYERKMAQVPVPRAREEEHKSRVPQKRKIPAELRAPSDVALAQDLSNRVISKEQKEAEKLCADFKSNFIPKRMGLILAMYDVEKLFFAKVSVEGQTKTLIDYILLDEERFAVFFQTIVNDLDVLMKMPFQILADNIPQHQEAKKILESLNRLKQDFFALAKSPGMETTTPQIALLMSKYSSLASTNLNKMHLTPACLAATTNNIEGLKLLSNLGADLTEVDSHGISPLFAVTMLHNTYSLYTLKALGVDLNSRNKAGATAAFVAAQEGLISVLYVLQSLGADLNIRNNSGVSLAYIAAQQGHSNVLRVLKELKVDIDTPTNVGAMPAQVATQNGHVDVLSTLKELGVNLNAPDKNDYTLAYIAAQNGHFMVLRALERLGVNLDAPGNHGDTPAFVAAEKGHFVVLRVLKALGCDINTPSKNGDLPAHIAAQNDHVELLQVLNELDGQLDVPNRSGTRPVDIAVQRGHVRVLRALEEFGVDLNTPSIRGFSLAYLAAQEGRVEVLETLNELNVRLDAPNKEGFTAAYVAAQEGHVKVLQTLKSLGVNLDTPNNNGDTPAHIVAQKGNVDVLYALKKLGAQLNLPNKSGYRPIDIAVQEGRVAVFEILQEFCIDLDIPNHKGVTFAYIAAHGGHVALLRALKAHGANLDAQNSFGNTPGHIAAEKGQFRVLEVLKILGANLNVPNHRGLRPVHMAATRGNVLVLRKLKHLAVNLDSPDNDGATPAFIAAQEGHLELLRYLIADGCSLDASLSSNAEKLKAFSQSQVLEVQNKLNAYIEKHLNSSGADKDEILVSIADIASIMGHAECLKLIQEAKVQRQRPRVPSFFSVPLPEGRGEEKKGAPVLMI